MDNTLCDAFVCSFRNGILQKRSLCKCYLTFQKGFDIFIRAQSAAMQQRIMKMRTELSYVHWVSRTHASHDIPHTDRNASPAMLPTMRKIAVSATRPVPIAVDQDTLT